MIRKIIFVGIHNKPDMEPLDSRTRTGKIVDRIIKWHEYDKNLTFVKANYFDGNRIPNDGYNQAKYWNLFYNQLVYVPKETMIIGLGAQVKRYLWHSVGIDVTCIWAPHPAALWSQQAQDRYVSNYSLAISDFKG